MKKTKTEVEQVMDEAIETINVAEERAEQVVESADATEIRAEEVTTGVVTDNVAVTGEEEEGKPANTTERFKKLTETHQKNIDLYKNNSRYSVTLDEENNRWVIKDKSSDSKRYISLEIEEENK